MAPPPDAITLRGVDGLRLAADAWGDPDAPPVLLLHGAGQTRQSWGDTGAALGAGGFRAIAMDWRGHGDSAWDPDGRYELTDFDADLAAVLSAMARPVCVVGASLGGLSGMVLAAAGAHPMQARAVSGGAAAGAAAAEALTTPTQLVLGRMTDVVGSCCVTPGLIPERIGKRPALRSAPGRFSRWRRP